MWLFKCFLYSISLLFIQISIWCRNSFWPTAVLSVVSERIPQSIESSQYCSLRTSYTKILQSWLTNVKYPALKLFTRKASMKDFTTQECDFWRGVESCCDKFFYYSLPRCAELWTGGAVYPKTTAMLRRIRLHGPRGRPQGKGEQESNP